MKSLIRIKIPWMQGSKIEAGVSGQWSKLNNGQVKKKKMVMKVTNIYRHEIVDTVPIH